MTRGIPACGTPEGWNDPGLKAKVYIDDINNIEKVCHSNAISSTSCDKRRIMAHAQHCEENFAAVKIRASSFQMSVNDSKTQLLCLTGNTDNDIRTYIRTGGSKKNLPEYSLPSAGLRQSDLPPALDGAAECPVRSPSEEGVKNHFWLREIL